MFTNYAEKEVVKLYGKGVSTGKWNIHGDTLAKNEIYERVIPPHFEGQRLFVSTVKRKKSKYEVNKAKRDYKGLKQPPVI